MALSPDKKEIPNFSYGSFFPVARMSVAGEGRTNLLARLKPVPQSSQRARSDGNLAQEQAARGRRCREVSRLESFHDLSGWKWGWGAPLKGEGREGVGGAPAGGGWGGSRVGAPLKGGGRGGASAGPVHADNEIMAGVGCRALLTEFCPNG
jgi:hypothetical protein